MEINEFRELATPVSIDVFSLASWWQKSATNLPKPRPLDPKVAFEEFTSAVIDLVEEMFLINSDDFNTFDVVEKSQKREHLPFILRPLLEYLLCPKDPTCYEFPSFSKIHSILSSLSTTTHAPYSDAILIQLANFNNHENNLTSIKDNSQPSTFPEEVFHNECLLRETGEMLQELLSMAVVHSNEILEYSHKLVLIQRRLKEYELIFELRHLKKLFPYEHLFSLLEKYCSFYFETLSSMSNDTSSFLQLFPECLYLNSQEYAYLDTLGDYAAIKNYLFDITQRISPIHKIFTENSICALATAITSWDGKRILDEQKLEELVEFLNSILDNIQTIIDSLDLQMLRNNLLQTVCGVSPKKILEEYMNRTGKNTSHNVSDYLGNYIASSGCQRELTIMQNVSNLEILSVFGPYENLRVQIEACVDPYIKAFTVLLENNDSTKKNLPNFYLDDLD